MFVASWLVVFLSAGWMVCLSVDWFIVWVVGCFVSQLVGWGFCQSVSQLVGWLTDWLVYQQGCTKNTDPISTKLAERFSTWILIERKSGLFMRWASMSESTF